MLGVAPLTGTKVNPLPKGIQTQPYWLVKTHWPAGALACTATSVPVSASTSVGGGGTQVGAGLVGWTACAISSSARTASGEATRTSERTTTKAFLMASPCFLDAPPPVLVQL
jgi:hypothetical protein